MANYPTGWIRKDCDHDPLTCWCPDEMFDAPEPTAEEVAYEEALDAYLERRAEERVAEGLDAPLGT